MAISTIGQNGLTNPLTSLAANAVSSASGSALTLKSNGGTTAVTVDTSQNVGIGTTNPLAKLHLQDNAAVYIQLTDSGDGASRVGQNGTALTFGVDGSNGTTERMRITSGGELLIGGVSATPAQNSRGILFTSSSVNGQSYGKMSHGSSTSFAEYFYFYNGNGLVGSISSNGSTTTYSTSSDYRLKENVSPMQNALDVVQQLKPVTYKWKADGSDGQGFIAHELQAIVPDAVVGEKDAVDSEGNPQYQGIDTSFLVATLTAAIQELNAKVTELEAKLASK